MQACSSRMRVLLVLKGFELLPGDFVWHIANLWDRTVVRQGWVRSLTSQFDRLYAERVARRACWWAQA